MLVGFIFDMLTGIKFGYYFIPTLIMAAMFYFLPFVFIWLNIAISLFAAFTVFLVWSYLLTGGKIPSGDYIIHIAIYLILIGAIIYLINVLQKK